MTERPRPKRSGEDQLSVEEILRMWAEGTANAVKLVAETDEVKEIRSTLKGMFQRWADKL